MESPGDIGSTERKLWVFGQLLRAEGHWTQQVQNQQSRIATILSVNGIMLAFVAGGQLLTQKNQFPHNELLGAVTALAAGVVFGVLALLPITPVDNKAQFISSNWLKQSGITESEKRLLDRLSDSIDTMPFKSRLLWRRALMLAELAMIATGTVFLVVAISL
ncbi:MAG TPA: hypothetical protein VEJ87_09500 [Acidimicrobiales bacterium]|nr:hypothetical protein [Acidimicrobiales bacterium]